MASFRKKQLKILSGTESQKMARKCKLHTAAPPRHAGWWKIASALVQSTYQGWRQTGCQSFFRMSHGLTADWSFNARYILWRKDLEFTRSVLKKSRLEKVSVTQVVCASVFFLWVPTLNSVHNRSEKFENTTLFVTLRPIVYYSHNSSTLFIIIVSEAFWGRILSVTANFVVAGRTWA